MTRNKQQVTFTLFPSTIECLKMLKGAGCELQDLDKDSMSASIEAVLAYFLRVAMRGHVNKALLESCRSREEVATLWLAIQKAKTYEGKVKGFKIHEMPEAGIVAVEGPFDPVGEKGEITAYPPRKGKIRTHKKFKMYRDEPDKD